MNLGAAIPEASHRLLLLSFMLCPQYFSLSFCTQVRPVISFLIGSPESVLQAISARQEMRLFSSTTSARFFESGRIFLCILAQNIMAFDP